MNKSFILSATFFFLSFWSTVHGAVMYVNPNPDITYNTNGPQQAIDIDNNGTPDIRFRLDYNFPMAYYYHLGDAAASGSEGMMDASLGLNPGGGFPYWRKLTAGTSIGPASPNFQPTFSSDPVLGDVDNNNIINAGDVFIGLKFIRNGNTHYAWMRINLTGNNSSPVPHIVKDWAYESTPNTAISAGDMGSGTGNVVVTGITVTGQGGASAITVNDGTLQMTATVTPANATNQAVTWSVQNGTGTATINTTGLLTAQTNGTVTVKATAQDGSNVSGTKVITISNQTTVGIADVNLLASSYYPNPVRQELNLQFAQQETIRNIYIYNVAGQIVYQDAQQRKGMLMRIPTASLANGTYILTFENINGKQGLQKFVKQ